MENSQTSLWATVSRNKFNNFQTAMNCRGKKPQKEYKRIERNILGKMIVALRSNRDIDQEDVVGNYELSIVANFGILKCGRFPRH